jgi:hypothetical protein
MGTDDADHNYVNGTFDNNGECIFPDANCGPDLLTKDCCDANESETSYPPIYAVLVVLQFIPYVYMKCSKTVEEKEEFEKEKQKNKPKFLANMGRLEHPLTKLFYLGLIFYFSASLTLFIMLNKSYAMVVEILESNFYTSWYGNEWINVWIKKL